MLIEGLQDGVGTAANGLVITNIVSKVCGILWSAKQDNSATALATACTFHTPFKIGIHFDASDTVAEAAQKTGGDNLKQVENGVLSPSTAGEGIGYNGFWLAYWQNTC